MIVDHSTPLMRGGATMRDNGLPTCHACNSSKAAFTLDEFRFWRALRGLNLRFRFACDPAERARDWLCCYSSSFMRTLFLHNYPAARRAFRRGNGRS